MILSIVIVVSIIFFFGFPILTLYVIRRTQTMAGEEDKKGGYSELKASILFLQMAFPAILTILGALGYGLYEGTVEKVTRSVQAKVDTLIQKKKIVEWIDEIDNYRKRAEGDVNMIAGIASLAQDSISSIAKKSFLKLLPKGTIIPFKGARTEIDFEYWTMCDGTKGTPDLRDRFILGSTFLQQGGKGGASSHSHSASTVPRGQVSKRQMLEFPHKDGTVKEFQVERHEHSFNGIASPVNVARSEHIPPFYRLVFLMKIK